MKSSEVRKSFLKYFQGKDHLVLPSSSLVPKDDPTLLFTNAGMNQFKNVFLGLEPPQHPSAVTVQKCVRAGGKHNDLENVGFTARHHTFFEMLGNFSFGSYFKKEAIHLAWEFLTKTLSLPKERLYVTVFETDEDAADIWHKQEGVPKERIYRFGEKDNFWRMGDTGPCGPCSEIFWDHGPEADLDPKKPSKFGDDGDRFVEIWNLVFMQYFEEPKGKLTPLPRPCVDTGSGFERLTAVLQGQPNNYDTDLFFTLFEPITKISGKKYLTQKEERKLKDPTLSADLVAMRVVADHARAAAFLIADGVLPSNEGRGYVLRRIMRRAIRFARELSMEEQLYPAVVTAVVEQMKGFYPELGKQKKIITTSVTEEVSRFLKTLDQGTEILERQLKDLKRGDTLPGDMVFKLYDTFGFPPDLTRLMAAEKGIKVDESEFEKRREEARELARSSWKGGHDRSEEQALIKWAAKIHQSFPDNDFRGYGALKGEGRILSLFKDGQEVSSLKKGDEGYAIITPTYFYAEGGGQIGDQGFIEGKKGKARVSDVQKQSDLHILSLKVQDGEILAEDKVEQTVEAERRRETANHHSATHLLNAALHKVLGDHVRQAGSLVEPERLRFDFSHPEALSTEQIREIEKLVNEQIARGLPVETKTVSYDEAISGGAMSLAGEKYDHHVRVISMGDYSKELCGGTHVTNTSQIRLFKIVSETGVSSGVRRIEALTGKAALNYLNQIQEDYLEFKSTVGVHESWSQILSGPKGLQSWLKKNKEQIKTLEQNLKSLQSSSFNVDEALQSAKPLKSHKGARWVLAELPVQDRNVLSEVADQLRDKLGQGVAVVLSTEGPSHALIVSVSKDLSSKVKAGEIVKALTQKHKGKGGGRADFAQGALENLSGIQVTLSETL